MTQKCHVLYKYVNPFQFKSLKGHICDNFFVRYLNYMFFLNHEFPCVFLPCTFSNTDFYTNSYNNFVQLGRSSPPSPPSQSQLACVQFSGDTFVLVPVLSLSLIFDRVCHTDTEGPLGKQLLSMILLLFTV